MEITQLHYFKTVAQYGSFTAAAEQLHITQSALSRSIAALESDIGFQLFERIGNRIYLNANGRFFLSHVKDVLNTLQRTVEDTQAMAGLEQGVIHIAVSETVFLKHIIHNFLLRYPNVRITCQVQSDEQIRTSLEEGNINFAVTRNPIISPSIVWNQVYSDCMMAMLPNEHPLRNREGIYLAELSKEHFIISNIGYQMRSEVVELCNRAGFQPYVIYEGTGEDLAGMLVGEGLGAMLAPYTISQGVQVLRFDERVGATGGIPILDDFATMPIGICARFGQFQSQAAQELYQDISDYFTNLPPCPLDQFRSKRNGKK